MRSSDRLSRPMRSPQRPVGARAVSVLGAAAAVILLMAVWIAGEPGSGGWLAAGSPAQAESLSEDSREALEAALEARRAAIEAAAAAVAAAGSPPAAPEGAAPADQAAATPSPLPLPLPETAAGQGVADPQPQSQSPPPANGAAVAAAAARGVPPADGEALAALARVLGDPAARQALLTLLDATADLPASRSGPPAAEGTPPPGPGVGAGTGIGGLARSPALAAVSALSRQSAPADAGAQTASTTAESANRSGAATDPAAGAGGDAAAGNGAVPPSDEADAAPRPIPSADISALTGLFHTLYEDLVSESGITTQAPQILSWLALQFDDDIRGIWVHLAWQIALVVLAGLAVAFIARAALRQPIERLRKKAGETAPVRRVVLLLTRLVLMLIPITLFAVAAQVVMPLIDAGLRTELVLSAVVTSVVILRALQLVLHALLAPRTPDARLVPVSDETARLLLRGLRNVALATVIGYLTVEFGRLLGMPTGGRVLLVHVFGLIVLIATVRTLIALRGVGKRAIRRLSVAGGGASTAWIDGLLRAVADIWHLLASAYAIGIFFAWLIDSERWFALAGWATLKTLVIFFLMLLLFRWVQTLRDRGMMRLHGQARFDRLARDRVRRYIGMATTVARITLAGVALLLVLESWHVEALAWLSTGVGNRLLTMAFNVVLVLGISVALWEGVNHLIQRYLSSTDRTGNLIERGQRERTLLPLLRNVLTVFLVVVVSLILLSELGVDIAPLLAGAGVIGLAIGFGSQKLVQDVITGIFNLLEDTIAVGDVVQVGGHAGVVEAMSIRSLRLRDLSGNLHTIPFSGVDTVTNMTKEFSYYLMEVGIAYRENTDHVTEVLKEIGAELQQDAEYGPSILEPLEVLGVDGFRDSAVIIKARIKTKPIMQWWVGREFNRRMKHRFDALGIEIPFPHTTVYFGVDKQGHAPPAHLHVDRLVAMGQAARAQQPYGAGPEALPDPSAPVDAMDESNAASRGSLPDPDGEGPGR